MSQYEQYVEQQTALFAPEEARKQQENLQLVYDDLLRRFHLLQESLKQEQARVVKLEKLLEDYGKAYDTFRERVIPVPYSLVRNMFLLEEDPTNIFLCVDDRDRLLWAKSPEEMK